MTDRLVKISGLLFVLSLLLPALAVDEAPLLWGGRQDKLYIGAHCLALGWVYWPGWLANPLLFLGWMVYGTARDSRAWLVVIANLSLLGVISAVVAPFMLAADRTTTLRYPHVGYFVWLASIIVFGLAACLRVHELEPRRRRRRWVPISDVLDRD